MCVCFYCVRGEYLCVFFAHGSRGFRNIVIRLSVVTRASTVRSDRYDNSYRYRFRAPARIRFDQNGFACSVCTRPVGRRVHCHTAALQRAWIRSYTDASRLYDSRQIVTRDATFSIILNVRVRLAFYRNACFICQHETTSCSIMSLKKHAACTVNARLFEWFIPPSPPVSRWLGVVFV